MDQMNKIANSNSAAHEDDMDVRELWRVIRNYRVSIALIFISVVTVVMYITITTPPIHEATTVVMIKESSTNPGSFVFDFGMNGAQQQLQNEIEVLNSYNLHDQVVESLITDGSSKQLALFGTRYVRKRFRLKDYFLGWLIQTPDTTADAAEIDFADRIKTIGSLRDATKITLVRGADVLRIAVSSTDSSDAVFLANRISNIYRNLDLEGGQGELHFVLTFLDSQIAKYEQRLARVEDELKQFQSDFQIYSLDGSAELMLKDLTRYEGIYYTNIAELEVAQQRVNYLKGQLTESEQALMKEITNTNNPMIVALRGKIAALEAQKIQQMVDEGWLENSLQARDFARRISEMKDKLTKITESLILSGWSEEDPFAASQEIFNKIVEQEVEVHGARSRANEYQKLVNFMSERLTNLPSQTLQYTRLERELRLNENLYLAMKQKYEESRITEAGQLGKVRILDPAVIARRVKPNRKTSLIVGVALGVFLGVGYAFLREYLDNTIKSVEQLERKGLTVLGLIPDMNQNQGKLAIKQAAIKPTRPSSGGTEFRRRLITYEDPKSPISESYRSLRTNLSYFSVDKKIKSLLVSSPQPGEGKSTTTANLAIAFAQLRKRTLLIDADLRKPVQHYVFDKIRGPGLAEFLIGEIGDINDVIHKTKIDNLSIITAGGLPPNPSELLGSKRMSELVDHLEHEWDMILFDSPPIVAVTDASMISSEIDAIAMVVKAGHTDLTAIDRAIDTLSNVKAPLAGVILNAARPETLGGKYAYYYSYYSYYSSEDKT